MDLPLRLLEAPIEERVISVDGAWNQAGLNLSHWPGNTTPRELKHDLSTGIALAFGRLPEERQRELAAGCVAIANNHYDTDGVCALFAVRHPELALPRSERLLDAAASGDFFRLPNERAFLVDQVVTGLVDAERSPWRARFAGLGDRERREWVLRELVAHFETILDGDLAEYESLWRAELEALRADLADLATAARDEITHLDLAVFTAPHGARASRGGTRAFDPGRHALFGTTESDRVLVVGPQTGGATYRFLIGTGSWFDLVPRRTLPRPALEDLCDHLNQAEGTQTFDEVAWRSQDPNTPSPELWFGRADQAFFAEHAAVLEPSRLAPDVVRALVLDALRASWAFPEE
jgi:hypothetical protein